MKRKLIALPLLTLLPLLTFASWEMDFDEDFAAAMPYSRRVAYLQAAGGQYIDTGYASDSRDETIELEFAFTSPIIGTRVVFGCWGETTDGRLQIADMSYRVNGSLTTYSPVPSTNTKYSAEINLDTGVSYVVNVGTTTATPPNIPYALYLFTRNSGAGPEAATWGAGVRIYSFSITRGGQKILDLIPVISRDGEPCMYDRISKDLFCNAGSGEFSYGVE